MNLKKIESELKELFKDYSLYEGGEIRDLIEEYFNALKYEKR